MSNITIQPHPSVDTTPQLNEALCHLLVGQKGIIHHLNLCDKALEAIDGSDWVCSKGVRALTFSHDRTQRLDYLGKQLLEGKLSMLEELDVSFHKIHLPVLTLTWVMYALIQGACPGLIKLGLKGNNRLYGKGRLIAQVLNSGSCSNLQYLDLPGWFVSRPGLAPIARALADGACPSLRVLNTGNGKTCSKNLAAYAMAMASGKIPLLEELVLEHLVGRYGVERVNQSFISIFGAVKAGLCPNIKKLIFHPPGGRIPQPEPVMAFAR